MSPDATARALTADEIKTLTTNGCRAEDWSRVQVAEAFRAERLRAVRFSGEVRLGACTGEIQFEGGLTKPTGLSNVALHNTTVGDDVYIENVGRHIAHYDIADGVVIENIGCLIMDGESAFGNGTRARVLVEAGGREVLIFDHLSSQLAYLLALYRERTGQLAALEKLLADYVYSVTSSRGTVGAGARIADTATLVNVRIGAAANITGALKLENGSVNSTPVAPVHIGYGVIAKNFIAAAGSNIYSGADITNCFVGQGAHLGRQFAAEHSLFFANFEGDYGEACSLFAGPYAASHHKSSLLLAALCSFFNAGSGTNFSNHDYKLGPLHQGILERGCKTGSSSHVYWPARIGAFTTVIGRIQKRIDTTQFPFSCILNEAGKSVLLPALNIFAIGTVRDAGKWRVRDRRTAEQLLDLIHYEIFSPYTIGRMVTARECLAQLAADTPDTATHAEYNGVHIPRGRLRQAREDYALAIKIYLGGILARRIEAELARCINISNELLAAVVGSISTDDMDMDEWVDLAGMYAPQAAVEEFLTAVEDGVHTSVADLHVALRKMYAQYSEWEDKWALALWQKEGANASENGCDNNPAAVTVDDLAQTIREWGEATATRHERILTDAAKEYDDSARIGFGVDHPEQRDADFIAVRGELADNDFVQEIESRTTDVTTRARAILAALSAKAKV